MDWSDTVPVYRQTVDGRPDDDALPDLVKLDFLKQCSPCDCEPFSVLLSPCSQCSLWLADLHSFAQSIRSCGSLALSRIVEFLISGSRFRPNFRSAGLGCEGVFCAIRTLTCELRRIGNNASTRSTRKIPTLRPTPGRRCAFAELPALLVHPRPCSYRRRIVKEPRGTTSRPGRGIEFRWLAQRANPSGLNA